MKNVILFLTVGRILFVALLIGQIVFVMFTDNDLFTFYEYPKTLTLVLLVCFGYALDEAIKYKQKAAKGTKKPDSDSHV